MDINKIIWKYMSTWEYDNENPICYPYIMNEHVSQVFLKIQISY